VLTLQNLPPFADIMSSINPKGKKYFNEIRLSQQPPLLEKEIERLFVGRKRLEEEQEKGENFLEVA